MINTIHSQELKSLKANRLQLSLLIMFLIMCVYAVWQGSLYRHNQIEMIENFVQKETSEISNWRNRLVAVDNGTVNPADDLWAGLAMDVTFPAAIPPGALSDFSYGVSDVKPSNTRISLWRSVDRLFSNYQVQSPLNTEAGSFDLAFIIIFIMPLLMVALSYDVLATDKESDRLKLILSQPISLVKFVISKLQIRLLALAIILYTVMIVGVITGSTSGELVERLPNFAFMILVTTGYFSLWVAIIAWVISYNLKGETTALALTGIWIFNCLVGPAVLSATAETLYPTPSRTAFLSDARKASSTAYKSQADIMQGMLLDHPDLTTENYSIPEYIRTAFLVNRTVDQSVIPILDQFDQAQASRKSFLAWFQYASPAALTLQTLNLSAGTNLDRYVQFEQSVRNAKLDIAKKVEGKVLIGERLTLQEYDNLPAYHFNEQDFRRLLGDITLPIVFLFILAGLLFYIAFHRLTRLTARILE